MTTNPEQKFLALVQKGWRITIPKLVRRVLELKEGQNIEVTIRIIEPKPKPLGGE